MVESYSLALQDFCLEPSPAVMCPARDGAEAIDHPLPGYVFSMEPSFPRWGLQRSKSIAHRSGASWSAENRRNLTVGGDSSLRNCLYKAVHGLSK